MRSSLVAGIAVGLMGLCFSVATGTATGASRPRTRTHHRGPLTLEVHGVPLAANAAFEATATNFELQDKAFDVACQHSVLTGTIASSGEEHKDLAHVDGASFEGGDPLDEELCSSSEKFRVQWDPLNPPYFEFFYAGRAELRYAMIQLTTPRYEEHHEQPAQCEMLGPGKPSYIRGDFAIGETPQPFVVRFQNPTLKLKRPAIPLCATSSRETVELTGSYTFTSEGAPVEVVGGSRPG